MGGVGVMGNGGPDAMHLVRGDASTGARTADHDRSLRSAINHGLAGGDGDVGIVNRFGVVGAEVERRVPGVGDGFDDDSLQFETGVIGR